jgi:hypothetical protein
MNKASSESVYQYFRNGDWKNGFKWKSIYKGNN